MSILSFYLFKTNQIKCIFKIHFYNVGGIMYAFIHLNEYIKIFANTIFDS